jgi:hypothetical protein
MDRKKEYSVSHRRDHMRRSRNLASPAFSQAATLPLLLVIGPMGRMAAN